MDYLKIIDELVIKGQEVLTTIYTSNSPMGVINGQYDPEERVDETIFTAWKVRVTTFLATHFQDTLSEEYQNVFRSSWSPVNSPAVVKRVIALLETLKIQLGTKEIIPKNGSIPIDAEKVLLTIFDRFHKVARQLRTRHANRGTLEINDEYDVQDLLHAILFINFNDIRAEEWTPSYAGGNVRVDFLLKPEKIVLEIKKTRPSMTAKTLGEELIIDIEKYREHSDCERLFCFVYDPEGRLGNPVAIMNDLNSRHEGFAQVIIRPEM